MGANHLLVAVWLTAITLSVTVAHAEPFRLEDLRWKHRVLLVFTPDESHLHFKRQVQEWHRAEDGMKERDLVWIPLVAGNPTTIMGTDLTSDAQSSVRSRYGASTDGFTVILLGRDGGVKLRRNEPVEAFDLFRLIDSMPMRQQEMRKQKRDRPSHVAPN